MKSTKGLLLPGNVYVGGTASLSHGLYFSCKTKMWMNFITQICFASNHPSFQAIWERQRGEKVRRGTLNQIGPHICLKFSQLYFTDNSHQSCAMSIFTRRKLWSQLLPPHQWCPFFWFSLHLFTHTYPRDPWHFATPISTQLCLSPHTHALLCY